MLKEFRKFILRGNMVELAVAFVMGASFNNAVKAMVNDLITPLIAAIFGKPDFSRLHFTINNSTFLYGDFINALVSLFILAVAIFFLIVQPMNKLVSAVNKRKKPEDPTEKKCPECLSEIPVGAKRCAFCTSKV